MIALVRVDNRLIHGQVVEAWLPQLKLARVVVADDEAAQSPLIRAAMALAVEGTLDVAIEPLERLDFPKLASDPGRTLVLVRDVEQALKAQSRGLPLSKLNLGNVHYATGRRQVSSSVFLTSEELQALERLAAGGTEVEARGVPTDRPVSLPEMEDRFRKGAP